MRSRKRKPRQVPVSEAKGQLTELVRRAEAGEEVVLTRHGHAAARLVSAKAMPDRKSRQAILKAARASASSKAEPGPKAARSQDFLYTGRGFAWMITVDTSALMAILLDEPQSDACIAAIEAEDNILISAGTVAEALIVAARRNVAEEMASIIDGLGFEVVSVTAAAARRIAESYAR